MNNPECVHEHPEEESIERKANRLLLNLSLEEAMRLSDTDLDALAEVREIILSPLLLGC